MIYAGFWFRALAILADHAVWIPVTVVFFGVQGLSIPLAVLSLVFMTGLRVAYPVYFLSTWGQTIGKMAAGIKVTRLDGNRITPRHAWLRSSVDAGRIYMIAVIYVLATWTGPEWSSLSWLHRGGELAERSPIDTAYNWLSTVWDWSELVVLLLNKKRRALHDFIAGTVVVQIRPSRAAHRSLYRTWDSVIVPRRHRRVRIVLTILLLAGLLVFYLLFFTGEYP